MTRTRKILIAVAVLLVAGAAAGYAAVDYLQLRATAPVHSVGGLAIQGYDPVAYFTQARPVEGQPQFRHDWNGATWQFASAEHLEAFRADPERYAPQFGGYCAFAVANGYTARIDPAAWHIESGKLYLNFDEQVRADWHARRGEFIAAAETNWPRVVQD